MATHANQFDYKQKLRSNASTKPSTPLKTMTSIGGSVMSKLLLNTNPIKFCNRYDDYYEFTNFYLHPVHIDGHMWPTTEHYFQAQKFVGTPYYDHIRKLPFPRDAFQVSHDPVASKWIRRDWSAVKDDVMLKALRVKFQDESLKHRLLGTKDKILVLDTSNDSYWGDGGDGHGLNKLGHLLMQVRDELRQTASNNDSGDNDDRRECPVATSRIQRSKSFLNLSTSNSDVTTKPTLGTPTNHPVSFSLKKHSELLKRQRNSVSSRSSPNDLQPSKTTNQPSQITRFYRGHDTNTHSIGSTYSTGDSNQYNRHGNSDACRGNNQYSHGSSRNSHQYSHGNKYSYSTGPYGTPNLTRKPFSSQAAVSAHINSSSRSKYSSNNGGYSSVTSPSLHRDRLTHKNISETTSSSGSSLSTKTHAKFYGGTNNTYRGSNRPSTTSYNIITNKKY